MRGTLGVASPGSRAALAAAAAGCVLCLAAVAALAAGAAVRADAQRVPLLEVHGAIGPAIADFVARGIRRAAEQGAPAVIVRLDTPGGLDTSMRVMIKAIVSSAVPVVTYVAPGGARAASAGTYLMYASHVAAMAPGTNLGAATPVPIGSGFSPGGGKPRGGRSADGESAGKEPAAADSGDAMRHKVVNDAAAYIRSLAELRGRNPQWAETAVREGASLSAPEALEKNVVDLVAVDLDELVARLDGRTVQVAGAERTLHTAGWTVERVAPDWRTRLLAVITNPNVAYVLMLVGVYGLVFELYSPGAVIPGIAGTISLVLALYALHLLPVNYAGVVLILVGFALMGLELHAPTFGALGVGGIVAFVAGSVMLFDTGAEGISVSMPLVVTVSGCFAALFVATAVLLARQRKRPVVTGREEMTGARGRALDAFTGAGRVRVHGEVWAARSEVPLNEGQDIRVRAVHGLTLDVETADGTGTTVEP